MDRIFARKKAYHRLNPHHKPHHRTRLPSRFSRTADLIDGELIYGLKSYTPGAMPEWSPKLAGPHEVGYPKLVECGGTQVVQTAGYSRGWNYGTNTPALPARRGRPSALRYDFDDDLYPVLEYLAHALLRRIRRRAFDLKRAGYEPKSVISSFSRIYGLPQVIVELIDQKGKTAAAQLIEFYRGLTIEERALKKHRHYLRICKPGLEKPGAFERHLERSIRYFLMARPDERWSSERQEYHSEAYQRLLIRS